MATYVLVPGGGHGGWCYRRVAKILRAASHDVYTPTQTGVGERYHLLHADIDLDAHIEDIVAVLKYEGLSNVILAGHSYGGMVITGVADRALSRVNQLVYLDAALPLNGESLVDVAPGQMNAARAQLQTINGIELVLSPTRESGRHYGVTDDEDVAWMADKLTPHPWKCFTQPLRLTNEAAVKKIPRTNINCTPTLRVRPPDKLHRALEADRVWEIDTGHDLMISEPQALAEMLLRLAAL